MSAASDADTVATDTSGSDIPSDEAEATAEATAEQTAAVTPSSAMLRLSVGGMQRLPFFQLSPSIRSAIAPHMRREAGQRVTLMHLPNEVIDVIFRYLSSRPHSEEPLWETFSDTQNAMRLALCNSRLLSLFRARMVCIRTKPERFREDLLDTKAVRGVVVEARNAQDVRHLSNALRLGGGALRELVITKKLANEGWVEAVVTCVTGLRKLSLRDVSAQYPLERVLQACSRSLRELEMVGATGMALSKSQLEAMATHCSSITRLALRLSMFEHDWTQVWMGIGPGLERLSLGATRFWIMDTEEVGLLEQVGRYCADVRALHFYHVGPTLGFACARLCARYGGQLERLELEQSQLLRADLEHIAATCGRTEVSVSHGASLLSHAYNADVVEVLGGQLRALRYRSQLGHDESVWEVGRRCMRLRELRLDCASTLSESALTQLLRGVGATLHVVSLRFFVRGGGGRLNGDAALRALAGGATQLRQLSVGAHALDGAALRALVLAAGGTLRRVVLTVGAVGAEATALALLRAARHGCGERLRELVLHERPLRARRAAAASALLRDELYALRRRAPRGCVLSVCGLSVL